jgi:hypothetical protein
MARKDVLGKGFGKGDPITRSIRSLWGMLVRMFRRWYDGDWHDLSPGHAQVREGWKCDLCAISGDGDTGTYFAHSEIEHLLATGCRGSLRRIVPIVRFGEEHSGIPVDAERNVILGLGSSWVNAGRTVFICVSSKESFDVRSLFIPHGVAESFLIEGVSIGSERLLKSPLPGILFTHDSFDIEHILEVRRLLHPGMVIVEITNMGRVGMCFEGCLMGPAAPGSYRASGATGWAPGPFPGVDHVREKD